MNSPSLNLLNFELPQSRNCKYVLTSPRSLKACRKAGIKPVDLLYKSLKDVERELGGKDGAQQKYQEMEKERQRKLGICRRIRNELLIKGWTGKQNWFSKEGKISGNISPQLFEENESLPIIPSPDLMKKTTECQENYKNMEKAIRIEKNTSQAVKIETTNPIVVDEKLNDSPLTVEKLIPSSKESLLKFPELKRSNSVTGSSETLKDNTLLIEKPKREIPNSNPRLDETVSSQDTLEKLDLIKNFSPREKFVNISSEMDLPEIIKKDRMVYEDINNNHDINPPEKRPSSSCRKKLREKRKLKTAEYKKTFENMQLQYSDPEYCLYKYRQVIENSIDREIREQDVRRVQRQIEDGLERWQDRVLLLQWLDAERAQEQVAREMNVKVERLQKHQREKEILHTINLNKVKEDEDVKAELLRREVENKNKKILTLHYEKERVICELKSRAQSTSELKDELRNITTPETFDKKVSKFGFEKKVLNKPRMCSRIMQRSHIRLG